MFDYGGTKGVSSPTNELHEFLIEFESQEACYSPGNSTSPLRQPCVNHCNLSGEVIVGYAVLVPKGQILLEVLSLVVKFHGSAKLKSGKQGTGGIGRGAVDPLQQDVVYMDDTIELISELGRSVGVQGERVFKFEVSRNLIAPYPPFDLPTASPFQKGLKRDLYTSMVSKNASVLYTVRASCVYRTREGEVKCINAVRGFSIVETLSLNHLPSTHFEPAAHHLVKKFGQ